MVQDDMKILILTLSDNFDHQEMMYSLYEELRKKNYSVYTLGITNPKVKVKLNSSYNKLIDCPKRPGICMSTFNIFVLIKLIHFVRKGNFDAILIESLHIWNIPILLFKKRKTKSFHIIHDFVPHQGDRQEKQIKLMNRIVSKLSNYIFLCNKKYISEFCKQNKIKKKKVYAINLWKKFPEYIQTPKQNSFLFFGRINYYKGISNLYTIAKECKDIHFDIVGRIETGMEIVINGIKGLSNVTVNSNYVSENEMKNYFFKNDWVILPYNSATQSGVIIDAYKYSKPVIAFNVGAISEQIDDKISGSLIDEKNVEAFIQEVLKCNSLNQEDYDTITKNAYQYGENIYSVRNVSKRIMKIIESLL